MNTYYGIDAPSAIKKLFFAAVINLIIVIAIIIFFKHTLNWLLYIIILFLSASGLSNIIAIILMIWSSKYGKPLIINQLVNTMHLNGNEQILDVGCGSGILTIAIAKKLTTGQVTGIDIWSKADQLNNSWDTTNNNIHVEAVEDKAIVRHGDMRNIPFPDHTFDWVVSSLAIHNLNTTERLTAIDEIYRVLKPGGKIAILDFRSLDLYKNHLQELGMQTLAISKPIFKMFPPTKILQGTKQV